MFNYKTILNAPDNFEGGFFNKFSVHQNPQINVGFGGEMRIGHYMNTYITELNAPSEYNNVLVVSDGNADPVNRNYTYIKSSFEEITKIETKPKIEEKSPKIEEKPPKIEWFHVLLEHDFCARFFPFENIINHRGCFGISAAIALRIKYKLRCNKNQYNNYQLF